MKREVQAEDKEKLFHHDSQTVGKFPKEVVQFPSLEIFQDILG